MRPPFGFQRGLRLSQQRLYEGARHVLVAERYLAVSLQQPPCVDQGDTDDYAIPVVPYGVALAGRDCAGRSPGRTRAQVKDIAARVVGRVVELEAAECQGHLLVPGGLLWPNAVTTTSWSPRNWTTTLNHR